jgi:transmembrane sensor
MLAWQEPLLRLGGATLAEVAASFEHRTGRRVILADPALGQLRLGGRFRADDIEGFASVVATTLDVDVEHLADGALVLRKKVSTSR